jgi:hypothetical protein
LVAFKRRDRWVEVVVILDDRSQVHTVAGVLERFDDYLIDLEAIAGDVNVFD